MTAKLTGRRAQKRAAIEHWYALGQRRCYCGRQLVWSGEKANRATFEHLVPASHGGTYALFNSLIICRKCNKDRGNMRWDNWLDMVNPPKKQWLLDKYYYAVAQYKIANRPLGIGISNKGRIKVDQIIINITNYN